MFAGNFFKSERFLAALWKYVTFNVKWFEVLKISEVFWAKLYSQKSDLFSLVFVAFETFCYKIWNQKKKKKNPTDDDVQRNMWMNIKQLYAQNDIFKKRIPNMRFWIIFWCKFFSLGTALGSFSQCLFFNFSSLTNPGGQHFISVSHHKKASYDPVLILIIGSYLSWVPFSTTKFTSTFTWNIIYRCLWFIYFFHHIKHFQVHAFYFLETNIPPHGSWLALKLPSYLSILMMNK